MIRKLLILFVLLATAVSMHAQVPEMTLRGPVEVIVNQHGDVFVAVDRVDLYILEENVARREWIVGVEKSDTSLTPSAPDGLVDDLFVFYPGDAARRWPAGSTRYDRASVNFSQDTLSIVAEEVHGRKEVLRLSLGSLPPERDGSMFFQGGGVGVSHYFDQRPSTFEEIRRMVEWEGAAPTIDESSCASGGCGSTGCSISGSGGCSVSCAGGDSACCQYGFFGNKCKCYEQMVRRDQ